MTTSGDSQPTFLVLGPLEVRAAEGALGVTSATQRRLLTALAMEPGRVVSADRLTWIVWGDALPPTAGKSLQSHVSRLRALLASAASVTLRHEGRGYVLDVAPEQVDAVRFEGLVADARRASDLRRAVAGLDAALALWRGRAFADFADEDFVRAEASRLEELRLAAGEDRFEAALALGWHHELVAELDAFCERHPLRERARSQLLVALYRAGRQADALREYGEYRAWLADELGVEPSASLRDLQAQILQQDPDLDAPADDVSAAPPSPPGPLDHVAPAATVTPLPVPVSSLVGRDDDIARVAELLARSRLVTLVGVGGVGKTRLAIAVAGRPEWREDGEVCWCDLAALSDPAGVELALAADLGVRVQADGSGVVEALASRRVLIVVDNCEHVLEAIADLVHRILRSAPRVRVLATSRERLAVDGEQVWPVAPLPTTVDGDGLPAARRLFAARAVALDPAFTLADGTIPVVDRICRRLDGLPLALELAAARSGTLGLPAVDQGLDDRFAVLGRAARSAAPRHATLRSVVDWSYDLLGPVERRVFARLSVFAGTFEAAAAAAVVAGDGVPPAAVPDVVADLLDKSMLTVARRSAAGVRYRMLETLRDYARERLEASGDAEAYRRRHARHVLAVAEPLRQGVRGPDEQAATAAIEREVDDLRAAHAHAAASGDADLALRLALALHEYAFARLAGEAFSWARRALELAPDEHPLVPPVCGSVALGLSHQGDLAGARRLAERGVALAGDGAAAALPALHALTLVEMYEGDFAACLATARRQRTIAEQHGDDYQAAYALGHESLALTYDGRAEQARALAGDYVRLAEDLGNPTQVAWSQYCLAEALAGDDMDRALELYTSSRQAATGAGNHFCATIALVSTSALLSRHGDPQQAARLFDEAIGRWHAAGDWTHQWITLRNLVAFLSRIELWEPAAVLLGALERAGAWTTSVGYDARRLRRSEQRVVAALGGRAARAARARGGQLAPDDVVAFARATVAERARLADDA